MNIKILSLSSLLFIANFMNGTTKPPLNKQEKDFYKTELRKVKKEQDDALLAKKKLYANIDKTEKGKIWLEAFHFYQYCTAQRHDCDEWRDHYENATKDYTETTEYKNQFISADAEGHYLSTKEVELEEFILSQKNNKGYFNDIEKIIKVYENTRSSSRSGPVDYTEANRRAAKYFRSLADQINKAKFEGVMPEYQ